MKTPKTYVLITFLISLSLIVFILIQQLYQTDELQKSNGKFTMSYIYNDILASNPDGYYSESVKQTGDALDEVSPPYFTLELNGALGKLENINSQFIKEMHEKSIKVVPFLTDQWNEDKANAALKNKEKLTSQVLNAIEQYNLDGVNVDIEHVTEEDREDYNNFVKTLRDKLPQEKTVSVAVAANPNGWTDGWHGAYDYSTLSQFSDYLMLMAYDEHSMSQETSGPVASLPFVEKSIQYLLSQDVPSEKIVLGIPFYGRIWKDDGTIRGLDVSLKIAKNLIEKYDGNVVYDGKLQSPMARFTIKENDDLTELKKWDETLTPGTYTLWYENKNSIKAKLELAQKYNLKGTGIWSLGQETNDIWDYYNQWLSKQ